MFPQFGQTGGARTSLVEFNAGKMTAVPKEPGSTKLLVTPDIQKGKIVLVRGDDQLLHFQWKNRTTGANVDDYILFPHDATFEKVDTSRPNDRVYILQYKASSRRFFYWLQNKDSSKDAELTKKVNDLINTAAPQATGGTSARTPGGGAASGGGQLDHNAIMQMLGALGGGQETTGGNGAPNAVQMAELQQILQHMGMPQGSTTNTASPVSSPVPHDHDSGHEDEDDEGHDDVNMEELSEEELLRLAIEESMRDVQDPDEGVAPPSVPPTAASSGGIQLADFQRAMALAQQQHAHRPVHISMTQLLQQPAVFELLHDPEVQAELLPHLPDSMQTVDELLDTPRTPQLQQCIGALAHALNTSNFDGILSNFGLNPAAGQEHLLRGDGIRAFLAAIQDWAAKQNGS
ncbi:hypothetical protein H310_12382 [Aphanomyces invadans]|uniref:Uncharacterized protein n=1 Tax=Aphanomyces invadans TaxID=157072 RepID=A0A024TIJ3_9STRA|nr:hypothetical protein H310_12382 [Aphanomyces invadans]ETV93819.1 hypothetical protein H310_12382 [Aphanomyces invadans]|eukprot:XP_008877628.1 hypothetical protein H310_12382 [Aphanomyces invadans]